MLWFEIGVYFGYFLLRSDSGLVSNESARLGGRGSSHFLPRTASLISFVIASKFQYLVLNMPGVSFGTFRILVILVGRSKTVSIQNSFHMISVHLLSCIVIMAGRDRIQRRDEEVPGRAKMRKYDVRLTASEST